MDKPKYAAPHSPGVYIMRDKRGKVLYVGKAKDLKHRVDSYFSGTPETFKTQNLVRNVQTIEFIVVHSEAESLVLENNLIKEHQPPYNILLKEGVPYAYVKITNEQFPRLLTVRSSTARRGERVLGPFPFGIQRSRTVRMLQKTFRLRVCKVMPTKPCLQYYLGFCSAPCAGHISKEDYDRDVESASLVLSGGVQKVLDSVTAKMKETSANQNFEAALLYRNQMQALHKISQVQDVERPGEKNQAVIGLSFQDGYFFVQVLQVEHGVLKGRESFSQQSLYNPEFSSQFLRAYFANRQVPDEIILRQLPEDHSELSNWLSQQAGKPICIVAPSKGRLFNLIDLAEKNAALAKLQVQTGSQSETAILPTAEELDLQRALGLQAVPHRIECFDISHLFGNHIVGSMVCFDGGVAYKPQYRHFRIRTVSGKSDDPASIKEIVYRRYSRLVNEKSQLPDLVVIDGGKGQLHAALEALEDVGVDLPCISLAKKLEEIYSPDAMEPLALDHKRPGLKLLQRARDEAHRFGITYHRKLRGKAALENKKDYVY